MFLFICNAGGVIGISYTFKEHQQKNIYAVLINELCKRCIARRDEMMTESNYEGAKYKCEMLAIDGRSQIIAIY